MAVIHIHGLCLAIHDPDHLNVTLINSLTQPTPTRCHLPSLYARRTSVAATALPPLPSIAGRWASDRDDSEFIGWDLAGRRLRIRGGNGTPVTVPSKVPQGQQHPDPVNPEWSDMRWVFNQKGFLPHGTVRPSFTDLSRDITSQMVVEGGVLEGGKPFSPRNCRHVWKFNDGYETAFTDTLDVRFDGSIAVEVFDGHQPRGTIETFSGGELWLINEMAPGDAQGAFQALAPEERASATDLTLYVDAFDAPEPEKQAARNPVRGRPFIQDPRAGDTPTCGYIYVDRR